MEQVKSTRRKQEAEPTIPSIYSLQLDELKDWLKDNNEKLHILLLLESRGYFKSEDSCEVKKFIQD